MRKLAVLLGLLLGGCASTGGFNAAEFESHFKTPPVNNNRVSGVVQDIDNNQYRGTVDQVIGGAPGR